jgi:hypothetical protein
MKTKNESAPRAQKKANILFAFVWVVGPDGLEPPTYAL